MNHFFFMTRESKAQKQRPVGLDNHINEGIISDTAHSMILKDVKVSQSPGNEPQERRPVPVNLNGGFFFHASPGLTFTRPVKGRQTFATPGLGAKWVDTLSLNLLQ